MCKITDCSVPPDPNSLQSVWYCAYYILLHIVMQCSALSRERCDSFDYITDVLEVNQSVNLFQKDDLSILAIMMGGYWDIFKEVETETYVTFVVNSLSFVSRMINTYGVMNWAYLCMHGVAYETPMHTFMWTKRNKYCGYRYENISRSVLSCLPRCVHHVSCWIYRAVKLPRPFFYQTGSA